MKSLKEVKNEPVDMNLAEMRQMFMQLHGLGKYNGPKFNVFLSKNLYILDKHIKKFYRILEMKKPERDSVMQKYVKREEEIFIEFSRKNENDQPVMKEKNGQQSYDIPPANTEAFERALEAMRTSEEFSEAWGRIKVFDDLKNELEREKHDVTFHLIHESNVPEEMTGSDRYFIEGMIVYEDDEDLAEEFNEKVAELKKVEGDSPDLSAIDKE